jgi:uncharacterized peroxidase-related enzyme
VSVVYQTNDYTDRSVYKSEKEETTMARLTTIQPTEATGRTKELLEGVQRKLGVTPNMMKTMANSPAVLEGYLNFSGALAKGALSGGVREQIALTVAETNRCAYCLSAHTALGKGAGLSDSELSAARTAESADPKTTAALVFARTVTQSGGRIADADMEAIRAAGYTEGEIAEVLAAVALNVFTNYFNIAAQVEVDFPPIEPYNGE